ncbi:MAG: ATP-binding cassette domain-containing protein [Chitinispirillaceae bacterium]|jgi:ABC-type multidrug transport system ATPase subunit
MPPEISVSGLAKSFGKYSILEDISFEINAGEVYGLVGLNGAGKTTLIRLLIGVLKADRGLISVLGKDPWSHDASLHRRMGVVIEHDGFWGNLSFEQNMKIFAAAKSIVWSSAFGYIEDFWDRTGLYRNKKAVKFFSRGQRMQCALCRAFMGWPSVYFFDEPAVALDVDAYDHFTTMVKRARDNGAAVVISSHQLDAIDDLCDRVGMLHDKRLAELSPKKESGGQWSLETDRNETWAAIIKAVCTADPVYRDGEWQFEVQNAAKAIPMLVKRLVEAGCSIGKIAPAPGEFSDTIRNEYRRKSGLLSVQKGTANP